MRPENYGLKTEQELLERTLIGPARKIALEKARQIFALALSPGKDWREINVNDNVRVKLTARGRELHRRNHEQLVSSLPASAKLKYFAPKEDVDGWSEWQLWCLMQEFGPHMLMGCEPPFETTIKLPSPPIGSRAEDSCD